MDNEYRLLLERSIRNEEKMISVIENNTKIAEAMTQNVSNLNATVDKINGSFHNEMVIIKDHMIKTIEGNKLDIKEMKGWVVKMATVLATVLALVGGLKITGVL